MIEEAFRTLYLDPGDNTGWALGKGDRLLGAGTELMWPCWQDAWDALNEDIGIFAEGARGDWLRSGVSEEDNTGPIGRIVLEDFRLYEWKAADLAFDPLRTPKIIGAYRAIARIKGIQFVAQPAKIKERAVAGGAEEFYYTPLQENRHQNDAIQHFFFYTQTALRGIKLPKLMDEAKDSFENPDLLTPEEKAERKAAEA